MFSAETKSDAPQQVSDNFSGMDLQDVLVVEICAGRARLTKTVRSKGMRGLAVDKSKGRSCGTEIMLLDLTGQHDLQSLLQILQSEASRITLVIISPVATTHMRHADPALEMENFHFQQQKKLHTLGCFVNESSTWLKG